jgi:hypothetical protein
MEKKHKGFVFGAFTIPEIEVTYRPYVSLRKLVSINSFQSAGRYFYETWDKGKIGIRESIRIMLLSNEYLVLGIYELTIDLKSSQLSKYIFLPALRANACAVCVAVGHISFKMKLRYKVLLDKLIKEGKLFEIDIWDFVLVSRHGYYSLRKEGLMSEELTHDTLGSGLKLETNQGKPVSVDCLNGFIREVDLYDAEKDSVSTGVEEESNPTTEKEYSMPIARKEKFISNNRVRNVSSLIRLKKLAVKHEARVTGQLHQFVYLFKQFPEVLKGPIRSIKIEEHLRPTKIYKGPPNYNGFKSTCQIRLTGNWIFKAGLTYNQQLQVIPLDRMLILIPESEDPISNECE